MTGINLIENINSKLRTFEAINGRKANDDERREICRRVKTEWQMLRTMERYNIKGSVTIDEIRDKMELDEKQHEAEVIKQREEDHRRMHGIPRDKAEAALKVFMSTIPERYKDASLTEFNSGATVVQHIMDGGSCLLTGPTGCGKTRMLYAVCKHICRNYEPYEVMMDTLPTLIAKIHENSGASDWIEYASEKYGKSTKLLVIDEFDKCKGSDSDYEILNHIVNERYSNMLQTIVAGNGDIEVAKSLLGDAVVSRLTGRKDGGRYFCQNGKDRRQ